MRESATHRGTDTSISSSATCSTCPTESTLSSTEADSTLTENSQHSSSARSTQSEDTIVAQPLLFPTSRQTNVTTFSPHPLVEPVRTPLYQTNYTRTRPLRPAPPIPPHGVRPTVLPSRSLVDLIAPQNQVSPRRNSTGPSIMYETSM